MCLNCSKKALLDRRQAAFAFVSSSLSLSRHLGAIYRQVEAFQSSDGQLFRTSNAEDFRNFNKFRSAVCRERERECQNEREREGKSCCDVDSSVDCNASGDFEVGESSAFVAQPQRARARRAARVACFVARSSQLVLRLGSARLGSDRIGSARLGSARHGRCGSAAAAVDMPHRRPCRATPTPTHPPRGHCVRHS